MSPAAPREEPDRCALVKVLSIGCLMTGGGVLHAEERRELGAHEHGHSTLNIAIEGERVLMELEAPGMDIVGFEHAATSDEDRAAVERARETLSDPLELFAMPADARCTVETAEVALAGDEHDEHGDDRHYPWPLCHESSFRNGQKERQATPEVHLPGSCTLAWEPWMSGQHGGVEKPFPAGRRGKGIRCG